MWQFMEFTPEHLAFNENIRECFFFRGPWGVREKVKEYPMDLTCFGLFQKVHSPLKPALLKIL